MTEPSTNFLHDYGIITEGNECPEVFHRWAGVSVLSHIAGRRFWLDWGPIGTLYPNLYLCFVGDPGVKKSTAMNIGKRLIQTIGGFDIVAASATVQAITQEMGSEKSKSKKVFKHNNKDIEYRQIVILANELVTLLNAGGNPAGMIEFLTDVWDQDLYEVKTKNMGSDIIQNPYVSMLACLTTDTVKTLISTKIVTSGMLRRCLYIVGKETGVSIPFPKITDRQKAAFDRLVIRAKELMQLHGEFSWEPEAEQLFEAWYHTNTQRRLRITGSPLSQFLQTKPSYVIKLAMILHLAQADLTFRISSDNIKMALVMVADVEMGGPDLMGGVGRNELSPISHEIKKFIELHTEPVNIKLLYATFRKDAKPAEIDEMVTDLCRTEELMEVKETQGSIKTHFVCSLAVAERKKAEKDSARSSDPPA